LRFMDKFSMGCFLFFIENELYDLHRILFVSSWQIYFLFFCGITLHIKTVCIISPHSLYNSCQTQEEKNEAGILNFRQNKSKKVK